MTQLADGGCNISGFHQGLNYFGVCGRKIGGESSYGGGEGGDRLAIVGGGR